MVFVGNLPPDAEGRDLQDFFRKYGQINDAWVARKPPGFGFVWFDDDRDARDACQDLDGTDLMGNRVRVEISTGRRRDDRGYGLLLLVETGLAIAIAPPGDPLFVRSVRGAGVRRMKAGSKWSHVNG
ncbi:hypothetical protein GUITHDRAFT_108300 [Guillardia theta CCMP2712]|uniref:RRM domain-containing protein n=1 Tax=Guillardia theta (strain CCMP2712) TaxID=905079 RepID=L1JBG9_GUITC|nr:hypothetical protein GUITHDRAFT_108300 [Guillardia theta CCMP2712]EKX45851.1 hypothetical protein GUITHDRAFT_108300 [Guillardia theta CCMP2712]|eukprot:XP_005832831.1 hypothetical protein GUITHDRAFT_108300 [Guillardia theta CCMP2712]